ncbi:hypothetical protein [Phocaeicola faecicola]|uniref:hypothetical protein n=1 Tax=Phocaeicola faecicola TaxID=2739389 RepID=UPI0015E654FC|nr:hypothetical protein [Phocaeicola faecicola]
MEGIIINELSLNGQFSDSQDFWKNGIPLFHKALQDAQSFGIMYLFKKGNFYGAQATPDKTLHDLLTAPEARIIDEAKRYKSILARAICNPFWDDEPRQDPDAHYRVDEKEVSGSSVAEAAARSVCLLSFIRSPYEKNPIVVTKGEETTRVGNIWKEKQLYSILFERGELSLEKYMTIRFSGGKLDFSLIDGTYGFSLIDDENRSEFIDSFRKVEELDWSAIVTDNGLDYKTYNKNRRSRHYFSDEQWRKGIKKFRITQRNRCFGYVEGGVFYVLRFDLDHELSDVG